MMKSKNLTFICVEKKGAKVDATFFSKRSIKLIAFVGSKLEPFPFTICQRKAWQWKWCKSYY